MTIETMAAVTAELKRRGYSATLEYPGNIAVIYAAAVAAPPTIEVDDAHKTLVCGDANGTVGIDICDTATWEHLQSFESNIPGDSTDVQAIADFIAANMPQREAANVRR